MFIERIDVERFGALARLAIDDLGPGVQVLRGTNETGKTTLLEFIRAVFFGFEGSFRRGALDPQAACAGRLLVRTGPERALVSIERRHEGPHLAGLTRAAYEDDVVGLGGDHGDLIAISDVDPRHTAAARERYYLQDLVGDIDETTFTNVMAFGLDELHELRTLEPEGCGSRLYELASGLDRSQVARVLAHLAAAVTRLDSADPAVSPLAALEARRADALERLAAARAPATAAGGLWSEHAHLEAESAATTARIHDAERVEEVVRGVLALEPLHDAWQAATERLRLLDAAPLLHPDRDAWRHAARRLRRATKRADLRRRRRAKLARLLRDLPAESSVWSRRAVVAALCEEQPRLERLAADAARAEAHARLAARRFGEQVGVAGLSRVVPTAAAALAGDGDPIPEVLLPEGFARSFGPLRARARACARAARDVAAARRELTSARRTLGDARATAADGVKAAGSSVADALEQATERVATIRRRIGAGEQLVELDRAVTRLEHDVADSLAAQLIPVPWLVALGALFAVGTGMLLSGWLLPAEVTGALAYALAALGATGAGIAAVTTWSLDHNATSRLEAARRQLEMTRKQREEVRGQCGLLDGRLPAEGAGGLERRLAQAQAEVDRLEELASREGSVHMLADRVTLAEQALERAREARTAARGQWRRALGRRGLPDSLSPHEVRQIAAHRQTLLTLDDDRRRLSEEARRKREELAAFARRIDEVLAACEIVPESTPLDHLRLLQERLDADKATARRRVQLARRLEIARRRHRHARRIVRVADRAARAFLTRWNVATEQDFLARVDRRPEHARAQQEAAAAEAAWLAARRRTTEPADVDRWLAEADVLPLATRLAEAGAATARLREALAATEARRREVAARLESAARDHGTEALQAELALVEEQLRRQQDRRRLLERARTLIEETRAAVARDHQPPVLREASRWLARLTEGRYPSITTAIDEARLEVHEADGTRWNPERLSRGTREQVFLALRLALVRDLGRHDVSLPVVMDDALVNFDDERARAAARVLVEFVAEQGPDRQLIALTCHEHVAQFFAAAGARVRTLGRPADGPRRIVTAEPVAVPTPVPAPTPLPLPPPPPLAPRPEPVPLGDLWPAEAFFFGAGGNPHPASADDPGPTAPRRAPRRQAARSRRPRRAR